MKPSIPYRIKTKHNLLNQTSSIIALKEEPFFRAIFISNSGGLVKPVCRVHLALNVQEGIICIQTAKVRKALESIKEIKEALTAARIDGLPDFVQQHKDDGRAGVVKLVMSANKKMEAYKAECARTEVMKTYEKANAHYLHICGIDEVGRGPLAGPVVTAAVILPKDCDILYLNDSKKLSEKKRELLYDVIMEKAIAVGVGIEGVEVIDKINILQATYSAMRRAVKDLAVTPDLLLVDAVVIPDISIEQINIIKGDEKSISIAAASIVAKVTRDRMMVALDEVYPAYGFASNKGYGASKHIDTIKAIGPCPIHRRTFIKNFV